MVHSSYRVEAQRDVFLRVRVKGHHGHAVITMGDRCLGDGRSAQNWLLGLAEDLRGNTLRIGAYAEPSREHDRMELHVRLEGGERPLSLRQCELISGDKGRALVHVVELI